MENILNQIQTIFDQANEYTDFTNFVITTDLEDAAFYFACIDELNELFTELKEYLSERR